MPINFNSKKPTENVPLTRKDWQTARDKTGAKAGMVKGVNLGDLLDAWNKAKQGQSAIAGSRNSATQSYALLAGLKKYRANPTVAKTLALRDTVDKMTAAVSSYVREGGQAEQLAKKLAEKLKRAENLGNATARGLSQFQELKTATKEVGTAFRLLNDKDDAVDEMYHKWLNITGRRLSAGGADADDADARKVRQDAGRVTAELAGKMLNQLKAMKIA
jgi:hypothetical protein